MPDDLNEAANSPDKILADPADTDAIHSAVALDALVADLIFQSPQSLLSALAVPETDNPRPDETMMLAEQEWDSFFADMAMTAAVGSIPPEQSEPEAATATDTSPAEQVQPAAPVQPAPQSTPEPIPAGAYTIADLTLYERLTGYRLVAQRQLWRSVGKDGNRSMARDRLFTVLAEEAFQLAGRKRHHGPSPQTDLTLEDIAEALKQMRSIAAHLGERGHQAADRLEASIMAAGLQQAAA